MCLKTVEIAPPFSIIKIRLPKFESLIVSEVRKLDSIFCAHMNLAIQKAPTILAESVISSIIKNELIKHSAKFLLQRELISVCFFDIVAISAMNFL